jgi:hypothetical protein
VSVIENLGFSLWVYDFAGPFSCCGLEPTLSQTLRSPNPKS